MCLPSFGWHELGLLIFPRTAALLGGVDGQSLTQLPLSHSLPWLIAPHSAYFAYGLDAYGFSMSTVFGHMLRVTAAAFGPVFDAAIVQVALYLVGVSISRDTFERIHKTLPV